MATLKKCLRVRVGIADASLSTKKKIWKSLFTTNEKGVPIIHLCPYCGIDVCIGERSKRN